MLQAVLVFDVSDRSSFESLEEWLTESRDFGAKKMQIVVCGNKTDRKREVSESEALTWAADHRVEYVSRVFPHTSRGFGLPHCAWWSRRACESRVFLQLLRDLNKDRTERQRDVHSPVHEGRIVAMMMRR
jgi:GTPase SAR1 family protein